MTRKTLSSAHGSAHRILIGLRSLVIGSNLRGDLLRGGLGSLAIKAAHAALTFAVTVTLARMLGPEGYGVYAFALAVLMILSLPAQVGLPQLVVRETAKAHSDGNWRLMRGLWQWSNRAVAFFSALVLAGVVVVFWLSEPSPKLETLAIGAALIPIIALGNLRAASLRGLRRVVQGQLPENVIRPLVLLVILLGAVVLELGDSLARPQAAMITYGAGAVAAFVTGAVMLYCFRPAEMGSATPFKMPAEWCRAIFPLAIIGGLQLINNQADIIFIGLFRTDEESGVYRAVVQLSALVVFGLVSMIQVLQPHFARLYHLGDMLRLQKLVTFSARIIVLIAFPAVLAFVLFGDALLASIFGESYRAGNISLVILASGQLVNAGMGAVAVLLNMTGHERDTLKGTAISGILNIILNLALVPAYGGIGAAAATAFSMAIWNILLWRSVRKRLGIDASAIGLQRCA